MDIGLSYPTINDPWSIFTMRCGWLVQGRCCTIAYGKY